jgi:cobalamin biosynthetic protein CobC
MRDHGGNLDAAIAEFGGSIGDWLDLSTGINPRPYPVPNISAHGWNALPTKTDLKALSTQAQETYKTSAAILATAGAQAGIQMIPRILPCGEARVLTPTYNEHAASLRAAGWQVSEVAKLSSLSGADLAVVVNPNNPDGLFYHPENLLELSASVGHLIVDESFADPHPELSVGPFLSGPANVTVLRSFGKFFGLAGVRLGFVLGSDNLIEKLSELTGPWPVSGPAIETGLAALADVAWQDETIARLQRDADRLDSMAQKAGWSVVGGTTLFRLYDTPDADNAQKNLARHHIWSRIFPYSRTWIRLGLTDGEANWDRLEYALSG